MESFYQVIERFKTTMAAVLLLVGALACLLILLINYKTQLELSDPFYDTLVASSIFMLLAALAIRKYPQNMKLRNSCILLILPVIWLNAAFTGYPDISAGYIYVPAIISAVTFIAGFWHGLICYLLSLAFLYVVAAQIGFAYSPVWQQLDPVLFIDRAIAYSLTFFLAALINRVVHQAINAIHLLEEKQHQRQRLSSLTGLVGGLAHEFNNPLQIIEWCLQALDDESPSPQAQKWIQKARQSAERMEDITHSLLFFTDSSARMIKHERSQKVLDAWQDARQKATSYLHMHHIKLVGELSEQQEFYGQRFQLSTILHAILQNAIDAVQELPEARRRIEISDRLVREERYEIWIRDYGPGISNSFNERIFEPFFSNKEQHIGLGLSTCFAICQALHWQLSFHTPSDGVGACFVLAIPNANRTQNTPAAG